MWDLIVSVPDHCLSFYFVASNFTVKKKQLLIYHSGGHFLHDRHICPTCETVSENHHNF